MLCETLACKQTVYSILTHLLSGRQRVYSRVFTKCTENSFRSYFWIKRASVERYIYSINVLQGRSRGTDFTVVIISLRKILLTLGTEIISRVANFKARKQLIWFVAAQVPRFFQLKQIAPHENETKRNWQICSQHSICFTGITELNNFLIVLLCNQTGITAVHN